MDKAIIPCNTNTEKKQSKSYLGGGYHRKIGDEKKDFGP